MEKKFIFLPGDMELNIDDTSCPSNKTSNWRYAILTFPIVDIILITNSQNMIDKNIVFYNIKFSKYHIWFINRPNMKIIIS